MMVTGLLIAAALMMAVDPPLTLRGREEAPAGGVIGIDAQGAIVATRGTGPTPVNVLYSWDRVATIAAPEAGVFMGVGQDLWRARIRVDRGDYAGAEPLLERHFPSYEGKAGPASALIGDGLMRCRLARGAHTAAVPPMLAYAAAVAEGRAGWAPTPSREPGEDWVEATAWDEGLGLSPALPPMWLNVPSVAALSRGEWTPMTGRAGVLSGLYQRAAQFEAGQAVTLPERAGMDDGAALVFDIVAARVGDDAQRAAGRAAITARLRKPQVAWVDAWCHAALGRSLAREAGADQRLLGVSELLHVPARHERDLPGLTGMCLAEAAVLLSDMNERTAAGLLKNELNERFPSHPALTWPPLEAVKAGAKPAATTGGATPAPATQPAALSTPGGDASATNGGSP